MRKLMKKVANGVSNIWYGMLQASLFIVFFICTKAIDLRYIILGLLSKKNRLNDYHNDKYNLLIDTLTAMSMVDAICQGDSVKILFRSNEYEMYRCTQVADYPFEKFIKTRSAKR